MEDKMCVGEEDGGEDNKTENEPGASSDNKNESDPGASSKEKVEKKNAEKTNAPKFQKWKQMMKIQGKVRKRVSQQKPPMKRKRNMPDAVRRMYSPFGSNFLIGPGCPVPGTPFGNQRHVCTPDGSDVSDPGSERDF